jgi:hypothetical protein
MRSINKNHCKSKNRNKRIKTHQKFRKHRNKGGGWLFSSKSTKQLTQHEKKLRNPNYKKGEIIKRTYVSIMVARHKTMSEKNNKIIKMSEDILKLEPSHTCLMDIKNKTSKTQTKYDGYKTNGKWNEFIDRTEMGTIIKLAKEQQIELKGQYTDLNSSVDMLSGRLMQKFNNTIKKPSIVNNIRSSLSYQR